MDRKPIYLDYNATTPIDPAVAEEMLPYLREKFGNPSSGHFFGVEARKGLENARLQTARMLGCKPEEIIFTSGGTESNNMAILGAAMANKSKGNHIITSSIEHPAVMEVCLHLENLGYEITHLEVDRYGRVSPADLERALRPETILVTIMHANNEVGTIQPVRQLAEIARRKGVLFHTDAAQSIGKIPVSAAELGVDLLSAAGHKLYAPKGVGALYLRSGVELEQIIYGANQERGLRPGTENILEIVGLGKAAELILENLYAYREHLQKMRDELESRLMESIPEIQINGHPKHRLPNTSSVSFPGMQADQIISHLESVAVSAGAACHTGEIEISYVLRAMKIPPEAAIGTVRISVGRQTTSEEIDQAVQEINCVIRKLRKNI